MSQIQKIDLSVLNEKPVYEGSVQDLFAVSADGKDYFLSRTSESGSVFDVGTIFSVPNSGVMRSSVRHYLYKELANPETWRRLTREDLAAIYQKPEVLDDLWNGGLLNEYRVHGASTHHVGMVDAKTGAVHVKDFSNPPSNLVLVERFPVYKPDRFALWGRFGWDYRQYQEATRKVIALEHVFRLGSPGGSSILSRYAEAEKDGPETAAKFLSSVGLTSAPVPWAMFPDLIYDCTTKYEPSDRSLNWQETIHLSGVSGELFKNVARTLVFCTAFVKKFFAELGFQLWDLKWEAAVDGPRILVVDTLDPDSVRVTGTAERDGKRVYVHFNKQAIRDYYKLVHGEWYDAINKAKKLSKTDKQGRAFMEIYEEGVKKGEFPGVPEVDDNFSEIQGRKYAVMVEPLLGKISRDEARTEARELMVREMDYFKSKGKLDGFLKLNG